MTASAAVRPREDRFVASAGPGRARLALSWTPPSGPGAPVWVFLHGLGSDRGGEKARRFGDHLAGRGPGYLALDFTGHGASGGDCRGLSLTRNLDDVGRAVSFVNEEAPAAPLVLVGSSMGGIAALWYAALRPAGVHRVFAIAPAFRMAARLRASLSAGARRDWADRGYLPLSVGNRDLEIGWGLVADEDDYPTSRLASKLRSPSHLLHGAEDAVAPPELSRDFADRCPAAQFTPIEGGDHRLRAHRDLLFEIMWTAAAGGAAA